MTTSTSDSATDIAEINRVRHSHLASIVGWFVSFGLVALTVAWLVYFVAFRGHDIVADPAAWGQLGDFMGGVLNPVLSFLTLFILAFTIILQSRQLAATTEGLELSRLELKATREELARSASAQERAEKALKMQAEHAARSSQLATMSQLYQQYLAEQKLLSSSRIAPPRAQLVDERVRILTRKFDELFSQSLMDPPT